MFRLRAKGEEKREEESSVDDETSIKASEIRKRVNTLSGSGDGRGSSKSDKDVQELLQQMKFMCDKVDKILGDASS